MADSCVWLENADGDWETECGKLFTLIDGTPSENSMKFCCYCGQRLMQSLYYDDDGED